MSQLTQAGLSAGALAMDVSDIAATQKLVASRGPFDILVNSAGTAAHSLAIDTTEEDYDAVANLNTKGAYFLTTSVAKALIAAKKPGSLINVSSQMAHVGGIERAVYCATNTQLRASPKRWQLNLDPIRSGSIQSAPLLYVPH